MKRHVFHLLTALSLAACLASAWLWVRGHRLADEVGDGRADAARRTRVSYSAANDAGRIVLVRYGNVTREQWVYDYFEARRPWGGTYHADRPPSRAVNIGGGNALGRSDALGFALLTYRVSPGDYTSVAYGVAVPHWFLVLAAGAAPAVRGAKWARRVVHRRRLARAGLCARCGYDLRATPGRCPECGAAPSV